MKNFVLIATLFFCYTIDTFAQGFVKPNTQINTNLPNAIAPLKPDLIISSFTLTSAATITGTTQIGNTTYRSFSVDYKASVKNIGTATCNDYNVDPFYSTAHLGAGFYMNNCASYGSLVAGASKVITGKITFKQPANDHRDARVKLEADSSCATEFLPDYNFVNELNETNNSSIILTVPIP